MPKKSATKAKKSATKTTKAKKSATKTTKAKKSATKAKKSATKAKKSATKVKKSAIKVKKSANKKLEQGKISGYCEATILDDNDPGDPCNFYKSENKCHNDSQDTDYWRSYKCKWKTI